MLKKKILILVLILFGINSSFALGNILKCSFETTCNNGNNMFFANNEFKDENGYILSSNVAKNYDSNYNYGLCCEINSETIDSKLNIEIQDYSTNNNDCNNGGKQLFYLTSDINARVGILNYNIDEVNSNFNPDNYNYSVCVNVPNEFSNLDIIISDDPKYKIVGYECLFKTSNISNGVVSSCKSSYDGGKEYKYTIWGKLWENINSLKCNLDCTSKLDGRVYSACSQKISQCVGVPSVCDGSLYGAWVKYDSNFDGIINESDLGEIQCSAPWDNIRGDYFTNSPLKINSQDNKCSNLITKKYSVIMNNELVTMNIIICNNN